MPPILASEIDPNLRTARPLKPLFAVRATIAQLAAVAISFGVAIWALIAGLDVLASRYGGALVPMSAFDGLVGLICGMLLFRLMLSERSRSRRIAAQLSAIAEINHHIRNALDEIELSAYVTHNKQLIGDIHSGVKRIEWTIKELLPETAKQDEEPE